MKLNFKNIILDLKSLEERFNNSNDDIERFAIINAVNYLADELRFSEDDWVYKKLYKNSLYALMPDKLIPDIGVGDDG